MTDITIGASRAYEYRIERGLLFRAGEALRPLTKAARAAVVCGDVVAPLYAAALSRALEGSGFRVFRWVFPHGEAHKTLASYAALLAFLSENGFTRGDLVVALGGGVCGDLAGFAAATYRRGCGFAQIPTTLLAAVDASVGGKCGVDLPGGKNQVGCFYQPLAVLCDPETFATLPERELRCGFAEVAKYGLLFDRALFLSLRGGARNEYESLIARCVSYKRDLIERDEFDRGERRLLNLGHSFGHAIEQASGWQIPHGEAVSLGMVMIARAAAVRGLLFREDCAEIVSVLRALGLPTECALPREALTAALERDKKREGDALTLVVPREIGRCELLEIPFAEAESWLRDGGAL